MLQSVAQFYRIHFHRSLDLTFVIARARIFNPLLKHLIYNSYVLIHIAYLGYEKSNIKVVCSEIILYLCGETEEDIHLRAAANYLNSGHYKEALNVLSGIKDRSARWYYYSSIANSGMGNNVLALEHAKEALRLEPSNYQYQSLVSRLENGGSWYRTQQTMYGGTPTINNDFCVKLCIANIMCNLCCGGGGFFCGSPYTYH